MCTCESSTLVESTASPTLSVKGTHDVRESRTLYSLNDMCPNHSHPLTLSGPHKPSQGVTLNLGSIVIMEHKVETIIIRLYVIYNLRST